MKVRVTLKDPDTMHDAVDEAVQKAVKAMTGLDPEEKESIAEIRAQAIKSDISSRWMEYGEYLTVEFDIDAKTATVIPNGQ